MPNPANSFLSLALRYVKRAQFLVFPLLPASKEPYANFAWQEQATRAEVRVQEWWAALPQSNVAIVTGKPSNILVIDIDPLHGGTVEALAKLCGGTIPRTLVARTGRDGWHYYFRYPTPDLLPDGWEITLIGAVMDDKGRFLKGLAPGIDVKGTGGYVLAPPSVHPATGKSYRWEQEVAIAPLPTILLAEILKHQRPPRPESNGSDEGVVTGGRNVFLTSEAGKLRRDGKNEREIYAAIGAINAERCQPPLADEEVRRIADSVARYAPAEVTAVMRHNQREQGQARREGHSSTIPDTMRLDRQEQEVVACILADADLPPQDRGSIDAIGTEQQHDLLADVCTILLPQHLLTAEVHLVFETILHLVERGEPYSLAFVDAELRGKENYPGIEVLASWVSRVTQTDWNAYVRPLCLLVLEAHRKRRMLSLGLGLQRDLVTGDKTVAALSTTVRQQLDAITEQVGVADNPLAYYAQLYRQQIAEWRAQGHEWLRGESSGLVVLDKLTGGLMPGKLWLVGGRASMGKTAWGLSCALVNALRYQDDWQKYVSLCEQVGEEPNPRKRKHVAIISLEMAGPSLVHRLAGMLAGIPPFAIMRGKYDRGLPQEEWVTPVDDAKVHHAVDKVEHLPFLMIDALTSVRSTNGARGRLNTHTINQRVHAWQQEHEVGAVIVDYLQLVKPPEEAARENRERQVAEISYAFKSLALERNVPVVLLAQLNRTVEHRDGRLPQLSDIRESGAVEQDIDVALLLFRKEYYAERGNKIEQGKEADGQPTFSEREGVAQLWVAKHRDGAVGVKEGFFDGPLMRYYDYDAKRDRVYNFWNDEITPEISVEKQVFPHIVDSTPTVQHGMVESDYTPPGKPTPKSKSAPAPQPLRQVFQGLGGDDHFEDPEDDAFAGDVAVWRIAGTEPES